jgi:hypothetical protein
MIPTTKRHVGVDQYGAVYRLGAHPRRELSVKLGCRHVQKMYCDNAKTGQAVHVGYVIAGLWIEVFQIIPLEAYATGRQAERVA